VNRISPKTTQFNLARAFQVLLMFYENLKTI